MAASPPPTRAPAAGPRSLPPRGRASACLSALSGQLGSARTHLPGQLCGSGSAPRGAPPTSPHTRRLPAAWEGPRPPRPQLGPSTAGSAGVGRTTENKHRPRRASGTLRPKPKESPAERGGAGRPGSCPPPPPPAAERRASPGLCRGPETAERLPAPQGRRLETLSRTRPTRRPTQQEAPTFPEPTAGQRLCWPGAQSHLEPQDSHVAHSPQPQTHWGRRGHTRPAATQEEGTPSPVSPEGPRPAHSTPGLRRCTRRLSSPRTRAPGAATRRGRPPKAAGGDSHCPRTVLRTWGQAQPPRRAG